MDNLTEFGISVEDLNKIYTMIKTDNWKTFVEKILKVWTYTATSTLTNMNNSRETDLIIKGNIQTLTNLISFEDIVKQHMEGKRDEVI